MADRRMMGTTAGRGVCASAMAAAVTLGVASCSEAPEYDYAQICARKVEPIERVDDRYCVAPANRGESETYGWYFQQFPQGQYDMDEGVTHYPSIVIVDVGGRPSGGGFAPPPRYVGGGAKVLGGVPPKAVTPGVGSSISRGGLGVSSSGSSGS